jgi:hypothetical protein
MWPIRTQLSSTMVTNRHSHWRAEVVKWTTRGGISTHISYRLKIQEWGSAPCRWQVKLIRSLAIWEAVILLPNQYNLRNKMKTYIHWISSVVIHCQCLSCALPFIVTTPNTCRHWKGLRPFMGKAYQTVSPIGTDSLLFCALGSDYHTPWTRVVDWSQVLMRFVRCKKAIIKSLLLVCVAFNHNFGRIERIPCTLLTTIWSETGHWAYQWDWHCPSILPSEGAAGDLHKPHWYLSVRTSHQLASPAPACWVSLPH